MKEYNEILYKDDQKYIDLLLKNGKFMNEKLAIKFLINKGIKHYKKENPEKLSCNKCEVTDEELINIGRIFFDEFLNE